MSGQTYKSRIVTRSKQRLRRLIHRARSIQVTVTDFWRFHKFAAPGGKDTKPENRRGLMLYHAHSIEKGLSRADFRPMFGESAIHELAKMLNTWIKKSGDTDDFCFKTACGALNAYRVRHIELGMPSEWFDQHFHEGVLRHVQKSENGNASRTVVRDVEGDKGFESVVTTRVTQRIFTDHPVDRCSVERAVSLAMHAPSACNRQSARLHIVECPSKIAEVLAIQGGLRGYSPPPVLLLVTSETSCYVEATERNLPYVDGALFAMTLLLSLEYQNLSTCALTAMMWPKAEKKIRSLLAIPQSETFVMFIGAGNAPLRSVVPKSPRAPLSEIVKVHES